MPPPLRTPPSSSILWLLASKVQLAHHYRIAPSVLASHRRLAWLVTEFDEMGHPEERAASRPYRILVGRIGPQWSLEGMMINNESTPKAADHEVEMEGLVKHTYTVSFLKANILALVIGLLPVVPLIWAFIALWGVERLFRGLSLPEIIILALSISAGIVVHELLHALGWRFFGQVPREAIKFGFKVEYLTPYAHSTQTMSATAYRLGTLLPGLALGLLPALLALATGSVLLMTFAVIFLFGAGGDLIILWLLRSVPGDAPVQDHPSEVGCYVYLPVDEA